MIGHETSEVARCQARRVSSLSQPSAEQRRPQESARSGAWLRAPLAARIIDRSRRSDRAHHRYAGLEVCRLCWVRGYVTLGLGKGVNRGLL